MGKLIRLELNNFKSYKGHHKLLFGDSYFTSIIGPNGSGKSNSMDAISFVLGIKSSHLRSAHLRDLVYRGRVLKTSKINDDGSAAAPNGHVNGDGAVDGEAESQKATRNDPKSAWVMAVYEDDAGDEQRWKRSIASSGSSEYRINDRVVTAQQYNDALESENILIKARNFLVFQGDVEAIASQSPKDLTKLIEQISGSIEYKAEYDRLQEEAEKAAEEQNYSLQRRRGMNSEIKQYQEQKREAENYQNKADERDQAIVTQILWKLFHFHSIIDESNATIHEHIENLEEYRRGVEQYEKSLEEARTEQNKVSRKVSKLERNIQSKEKDIEAKQNNELITIKERVNVLTDKIEKSDVKLNGIKEDRKGRLVESENFKKQMSMVEKAQKQFEADWQEKLKKQGKQQLSEANLKEYRALKAKLIGKTSGNQSELDGLLRQRSTDEVTIQSLKTKVEGSEAQLEKLDNEISEITGRRDEVNSTVKQLTKEIDAKKKDFQRMQYERVQSNQRRTELDEKLQAIMRQLREAEDGQKESHREASIRRTIVDLKKAHSGVKGCIGDLCHPKQKKYEEAVATALGRDFESIVVDTEETGVECVRFLKDNRLAPMTFIPLDNIKVTNISSNLKSIAKARLTIDTIDFDSSLERAMSYACGDSMICDDLKVARNIIYEKGLHVKAVTLDGTLIHKNGSMTGGRGSENRKNKRKFNEQDTEKLRIARDKKEEEMRALPGSNRKSAAEDTLEHDLAALDQRLLYQKGQLAAFDRNLADKNKEYDHEERDLSEMQPRYETKVSNFEALKEKVKEFEASIAKVQDQIFADFCKRTGYADIRAYELQQGNLEHEASEIRSKFESQKQRLQKQLDWAESEVRRYDRRIKDLEDWIRKNEQDCEGHENEQQALEKVLDDLTAEVTELEDKCHKLKEKLAARTEKVTQARNEVQKRNKEIDTRTKAIASLDSELYRTNSQRYALLRHCKLNQINLPLLEGSKGLGSLPDDENIAQSDPDAMDVDGEEEAEGSKDYGIDIDFEDLDGDYRNPDDEEVEARLEEKIHRLNSELEKLNPNMRAIDRLDGVEARLKSTEKDFDDARKAAKASRDAFNDVKEKRFDLFNKAFTHISEQISVVYKDLTRSGSYPLGGSAYLDIEDSDTPYLCGIKYNAMPPLKRFRDMEHLSGGEKTMAALALLFAVHNYQPSPFFVLDEVDAALDNANVEKIKNYIREHAGPGMQFIVISLKTGLFQGSESLVGVFRDQEANSSETLTLDLRKYVE